MNRVLLCLAAALLLGLPGCDDPPPCRSFPAPAELHPLAGMLLAGGPDEVTIFANVDHAGDCEDVADPAISSVYVEIFGPDQQPVANESSLVMADALTPAASIRFTPAQEGRYHFLVVFEPLAQVQQFDLLAVRDRSAEPPLQTLGNRCNALERTRSGTWLCDASVFRGPVFVETLPGVRVAVSGDVVWVASGMQLLRYKDTGTEMQLTATMVQQLGLAQYILASENEAVLVLENWIQRATFDGTELTSTPPTRWEHPFNSGLIGDEGPRGLLFRTGDGRLYLLESVSSIEGRRLQACAYELIEGRYVRTAEPCQTIEGAAVGFEPAVLWVADQTPPGPILSVLTRLELTETGFIPTATLSVPPTLALTFPLKLFRSSALPVLMPNVRDGAPLLRAAVPVYIPEQSLLRLEHLEDGLFSPQASPSFFWGNTSQGNAFPQVRIRAVAPPP